MKTKTFSALMKISVLIAAIGGLFICIFVIPNFGKSIISSYPEFSGWYWPWLIFAWLVSLPCFILLLYVWKVSDCIKNETVFTLKTAKMVRTGVILLLSDAALLFGGNIVLLLFNMNHPSIVLLSIVIAIVEIVVSLFGEIVYQYMIKAAILKEESEGTI